ncbi:MAG: YceI family protein [Bdellovibrionales bacterium]|nr:YceI family protein [Bdellovibrionales bacterium]
MKLICCFVVILSFLQTGRALGEGGVEAKIPAGPHSLFVSGDHCVAFRAGNRIALFVVVKFVGKNCGITAQVNPDLNNKYYYEVRIPVESFDSQETERDADIRKILNFQSFPHLVFKSHSFSVEQWKEFFKKEGGVIQGKLTVKQASYPVSAKVAIQKVSDRYEVDGIVNGQFVEYGISPPKLAGGIGAKVEDWLELHFHLRSDSTLGFEQLLGQDDEFTWNQFSNEKNKKRE